MRPLAARRCSMHEHAPCRNANGHPEGWPLRSGQAKVRGKHAPYPFQLAVAEDRSSETPGPMVEDSETFFR